MIRYYKFYQRKKTRKIFKAGEAERRYYKFLKMQSAT